MIVLDKKTGKISVFEKAREVTGFSPASVELSASIKAEVDKPIILQQVECVTFRSSGNGQQACGVHCQDGSTNIMACDADIFDDGYMVDN